MATKRTFNFKLEQSVIIKTSGEDAVVIARMHSIDTQPQYQLRYMAADGRAVESWWAESALEAAAA